MIPVPRIENGSLLRHYWNDVGPRHCGKRNTTRSLGGTCPGGRQYGSCSETGFEEISGGVLEADFRPGITSGLPVIRE
jgi:hypothetical protein